MTPSRLSRALRTIRWTPSDLGRAVNVNERTVRRWLDGSFEPPAPVLAWLEDLAAYMAAHPPP